jgi:hypothetical protein
MSRSNQSLPSSYKPAAIEVNSCSFYFHCLLTANLTILDLDFSHFYLLMVWLNLFDQNLGHPCFFFVSKPVEWPEV